MAGGWLHATNIQLKWKFDRKALKTKADSVFVRSLPQVQANVNVAADDGESCHRRKRFHSLLSMQCAFPLKKKTSIFASLVLFYALISLLLQIEQVVPLQSEKDGVSAPADHRHQQQQSEASNGRPLLRNV